MKGLLAIVILTGFSLLVVPSSFGQTTDEEPLITVKSPTVVAFFPPVTERELRNDPDTNEVLADFQYYAGESIEPLRQAGINFQPLFVHSFRVKVGKTVSRFQPVEPKLGYYLIAPGKKPRIVYGVLTNDGLLNEMKNYLADLGTK